MKKPLSYRLTRLLQAMSPWGHPYTAAVLLAGGSGSRMGDTGGVAKQWLTLEGRTVLERSVAALEACPLVDEIVVVVRRGEGQDAASLLRAMGVKKVRAVVSGGKTRQHSAYNGARKVSSKARYIAIHDAARCLVGAEDISAVISAAHAAGAASLGVRVHDTVKRVNRAGYIMETRDRNELWLAATPQVFHYGMYMGAATVALRNGREVTDDNMLMEAIGQRVRMVEAKGEVLKITTPKDMKRAECYLRMQSGEKS